MVETKADSYQQEIVQLLKQVIEPILKMTSLVWEWYETYA